MLHILSGSVSPAVTLPVEDETNDQLPLARTTDEPGISLSAGRAFSEHGEGFIRIAVVENEQRLKQAMNNSTGR